MYTPSFWVSCTSLSPPVIKRCRVAARERSFTPWPSPDQMRVEETRGQEAPAQAWLFLLDIQSIVRRGRQT